MSHSEPEKPSICSYENHYQDSFAFNSYQFLQVNPQMKITNLRSEQQVDPIGLDIPKPHKYKITISPN